MPRLNKTAPYILYLNSIIISGALLLIWSTVQLPTYEPRINLVLLIVLAALTAAFTASVAVSDKAGITYQTGPVISMAAIPFFRIRCRSPHQYSTQHNPLAYQTNERNDVEKELVTVGI